MKKLFIVIFSLIFWNSNLYAEEIRSRFGFYITVPSNFIAFQNENTEIFHFDLTANQFVCAQDKDMRLLQKFQGEKAKTVYLSASELHQNIKNVNFSQSAATGLSTTEYAENFCKNIGFYYIFGISDQGSEVIGCQPSELTQSAIMFKKTSENKAPVTIAAMGIYTPIINKQLNSSE